MEHQKSKKVKNKSRPRRRSLFKKHAFHTGKLFLFESLCCSLSTVDPALSTGHFALARAYTRKGQLEDATASLKAGLQFDPENRNAGRMFEDLQAYLSNQ